MRGLDTTNEKTKYVTVAAKMLYGKQYSTLKTAPRSFAEEVKGQHGALQLRYIVAMMAADYSPMAADVLGLRFADHGVHAGGKYIYRVTSVLPGRSVVMDSAVVFVVNTRQKKEPVPAGLQAFGYDRKIEIRWNRRQEGNFSGYFLERSDDNGNSWRALTRTPYNSTYVPPTGDKKKDSLLAQGRNNTLRDQQVFTDSIDRNYKNYQYRLRAINGFGELSPYATPVVIAGRDLTAPIAPLIDSARNVAGSQVKIWWRQTKTSPDLAGYVVERSGSNKGPFTALSAGLLDKNTLSFVDTAALPHQANYYVILAVDTARNLAASMPRVAYLTDSTPPAGPIGLTGIVDSNGIVQLQWKNNKEQDLLGYQVYASFNPDYQFSQVTKAVVKDNHFTDTIAMNSLDRRVYYKIVALDKSYNHSAFSATALLQKPVRIPPSVPVAGKVLVKGRMVDIEWMESRSEGAAGYQVYRKERGTDWVAIGRLTQDWSGTSVHFIDTGIRANRDYYYAAETLDSTGIRSDRSFAIHVRCTMADSSAGVEGLKGVWDGTRHAIALSWQYKGAGDYFFLVYRGHGNGPAVAWHSFEKDQLSGMDHNAGAGTWSYSVKVVRRDSKTVSPMGVPVVITVK
jgi:fibronectin type 3 domain-containing protein